MVGVVYGTRSWMEKCASEPRALERAFPSQGLESTHSQGIIIWSVVCHTAIKWYGRDVKKAS